MTLTAIGEQGRYALPAIAFTGPPYRRLVTVEPGSEGTSAFSSGEGQDNPGTSHLEPGQGVAMGHGAQRVGIWWSNRQRLGSASTHEATSQAVGCQGATLSIAGASNLVQVLRAVTLAPGASVPPARKRRPACRIC